MKIILKYKKTFIAIAIISFIISILPALGMMTFMSVGTRGVTVTEFETVVDENQEIAYEPFELSVPGDMKLEKPVFEHFNMDKTTVQKSFSSPTSEQEIMYQAYLEEGMTIKVSYNMKTSTGILNFSILDENGEKYTFSGTKDDPSFTIHQSGNYGVAYHANEFKGSFNADIMIKNIDQP